MKKKISIILLIIFAGSGLFCVISTIIALVPMLFPVLFQTIDYDSNFFLASKGERINVTTYLLTPCAYEVKHSIYCIPSVHEYYYAFMGEENKAYLARLDKSFGIKNFGENFSGTGFRDVSALALGVTGEVKKLKKTAELQEVISDFSEAGISLDGEYYLDTIYQVNYLWRFAVGVGLLIFSSTFVTALKRGEYFILAHKCRCIIGIASTLGAILLLQLG